MRLVPGSVRFAHLVCLAFAAGASASSAYAQAPVETVRLKNGGWVRGTVLELLPNDHATVLLANGTTRSIPWTEIERIERASPLPPAVPPTPIPVPAPIPALPPAAAPIRGPTATVHIESPTRVSLDRQPPDAEDWITACEAPCDLPLPLDNQYRIVGAGIHASSAFELDTAPGGRVTLTVHPGSRAAKAAGIVVAGVGVTAISASIYLLIFGATFSAAGTADRNESQTGKTLLTAGWITLGTGLAVAVAGGIFAYSHWKTGVTQD